MMPITGETVCRVLNFYVCRVMLYGEGLDENTECTNNRKFLFEDSRKKGMP